jgi:LacI family transcriptional regulator
MSKPTIQSVADAAGVSKATVSRYLNNFPHLHKDTKAKIAAAIERLGYRQNPLVKALMSEVRQSTVGGAGIVVGWLNLWEKKDAWATTDHARNLYKGAIKRGEELGIKIESFWVREPGMTPKRLQTVLLSRGIRHLIVPPASNVRRNLNDFDWNRFAVVSISANPEDTFRWHGIRDASTSNAELLLSELKSLGYQRPGLAWSKSQDASDRHVLTSRYLYDQFLRPKSQQVPPLLFESHLGDPKSRQQVIRWADKYQPDVIICCDRLMLDVMQESGRSVPKNIGLAHLNIAADVQDWSGLNPHSDAKGRATLDFIQLLLHENTLGLPPEPRYLHIGGEWTSGKTTKPA